MSAAKLFKENLPFKVKVTLYQSFAKLNFCPVLHEENK